MTQPKDESESQPSVPAGPPPGGYGLHEKIPDARPSGPGPATPFGSGEGIATGPAPQVGAGKRWVGFPLIGLGLLAVRLFALCVRVSEPAPTYKPITLPPNLPHLLGSARNDAVAKPPATLAVVVRTQDGTGSWRAKPQVGQTRIELERRGVGVTALTVNGVVRELAESAARVCWLDDVGTVTCKPMNGFGTEQVVASSDGLPDVWGAGAYARRNLIADADAVYFNETRSTSTQDAGATRGRSPTNQEALVRIDLVSRKATTLIEATEFFGPARTTGRELLTLLRPAPEQAPQLVRLGKVGGKAQVVTAFTQLAGSTAALTPLGLEVHAKDAYVAVTQDEDAGADAIVRVSLASGSQSRVASSNSLGLGWIADADGLVYFDLAGALVRTKPDGTRPQRLGILAREVSRLQAADRDHALVQFRNGRPARRLDIKPVDDTPPPPQMSTP
jgi:hypothetical protein